MARHHGLPRMFYYICRLVSWQRNKKESSNGKKRYQMKTEEVMSWTGQESVQLYLFIYFIILLYMERKKIWLARTCDVDRSSAHTTPKIILGGFRAPAAGCSHFAVHRQYTKLQIYCRGGVLSGCYRSPIWDGCLISSIGCALTFSTITSGIPVL